MCVGNSSLPEADKKTSSSIPKDALTEMVYKDFDQDDKDNFKSYGETVESNNKKRSLDHAEEEVINVNCNVGSVKMCQPIFSTYPTSRSTQRPSHTTTPPRGTASTNPNAIR